MIDTSKFNSLLDVINNFSDEQVCIDHLTVLRWNGNIISPFDPTSKVYTCKGNKYKCKNTGKYFNVRTQTLFDNTKIKLQKWFLAIYLVTSHKKGISSIQLSKDIAVTQKTAWFMLQRIRACFGLDQNDDTQLKGEVQVDETYVGGKVSNMHKSKKAKLDKSSSNQKQVVLGIMETNGKVIVRHIEKANKKHILPQMGLLIDKGSTVVTDNFGVYRSIKNYFQDHRIVSHSTGQYVDIDGFHTNSIEGFWSHFKRSILGIYHHCSPKHLSKYINESAFRYNTRHGNESERMNLLFSNLGVRTTYKALINE